MQYLKKVLVLKGIDNHFDSKKLNGILRVEVENGVGEIHISLINLPNEFFGDYYALFVDSKKSEFEFCLSERPTTFASLFCTEPKLENGFCVGIFVIKDSLPKILAFASDNNGFSLQDFKKILAERCLIKHNKLLKTQEFEDSGYLEQESFNSAYNDEAVATENYFEIDDEINQKLLSLREKENESLQPKNERFACDRQEKTQKDLATSICFEDEKDTCSSQENRCSRHFDSVKAELDEIFFKFPEEQALKNHFKDSRWAKIYYSTEKYYVVGVVYEEGEEKYICYGVPATYSKTPPKELDGFCSFIPLSVFDLYGAGYWIMFQDAKSGKCVHFN